MTETPNLPQRRDVEAAATEAHEGVAGVVAFIEGLPCTSAAEAQYLTDVAHQIKDQRKAREELRDQFCKPLRKMARDFAALFNPAIQECKDAETAAKYKVHQWQLEEQRRAAEAMAEARTHEELAEATSALVQRPEGMGTRRVKKWRVVDEARIPRDYWTLDEKKINAATKAGITVPGIEAYEETTTVFR